jgi:A/G-specific adenine glycosylase
LTPRPDDTIAVTPRRRRAFQRRLLAWYRRAGRPLPWRRTRNPYHILVSEIMLQQTQVPRVIPKYREWLRRYPSIEALARAGTREVREAWYPLGYNARPLRLREIARAAVRRHGGRLPQTRDALLAFKGIGRYTAGALLSFAFGQDAPILDTNVRRVLRRVFAGDRARPSERALWTLSADVLPPGLAYEFNQGLMDLGAMVCTARRPRCRVCPVAKGCASYPMPNAESASGATVRSRETRRRRTAPRR